MLISWQQYEGILPSFSFVWAFFLPPFQFPNLAYSPEVLWRSVNKA